MKTCNKCFYSKPKSDFYAHPASKDGLLEKCKECHKTAIRLKRQEKASYYKEKDRARAGLPHRVLLRKKTAERWKACPVLRKRSAAQKIAWAERNKEKRQAHNIVSNALRAGKITRRPCSKCGDIKSEAHHSDYKNPLKVLWLCRKHHAELHKNERKNNG